MKQSVIIKSSKNGMTLILDDRTPFEQLIRDICQKFHDSRSFFGQTNMAIGIEGRKLSPRELQVVIEAIELNSDIKVSMLKETDPKTDQLLLRSIENAEYAKIYEHATIINASVRKNRKIEVDNSVIILGDLSSKASVRAAGNVIVMGELAGKVEAGYPDNADCYIVANFFESPEISIGSVQGAYQEEKKWSLRVRKRTQAPKAVAVFDGQLVMEPLSSGIVRQLTGQKLREAKNADSTEEA